MGRIGVLAFSITFMIGATVNADQIEDLAGQWHSDTLRASFPDDVVPDEITLGIKGSEEGFTVNLGLGDSGYDSVSFVPTAKQGVYDVGKSGGLFSIFNGDSSADPLDGEPLVWARLLDPGIAIYNLEIDKRGHFELADLRMVRNEDNIDLFYVLQRSDVERLTIEATLSGGN